MSGRDELLIKALTEAAANPAAKMLERRQADLAVWYFKNHKDIPRDDLAKRMMFMEKMVWTLLEVTALQTERIHELEGGRGSQMLFLPAGAVMNGKKFA